MSNAQTERNQFNSLHHDRIATDDNSYYVNSDRVAGEAVSESMRPGPSQKESLGPPQAPHLRGRHLSVTYVALAIFHKTESVLS